MLKPVTVNDLSIIIRCPECAAEMRFSGTTTNHCGECGCLVNISIEADVKKPEPVT